MGGRNGATVFLSALGDPVDATRDGKLRSTTLKTRRIALLSITLIAALPMLAHGALDEAVQKKVDAKVAEIRGWASDATLVDAVKAQNGATPDAYKDMTNDKWKTLTKLDPAVRGLSTSDAAKFLRTKKDDVLSEAFLNSADGTKVALLAKTSKWNHKGQPKHDQPMAGKVWQGEPEVDESTGVKQLQVAVPVMDGDKPIGSLVVGLSLTRLEQ